MLAFVAHVVEQTLAAADHLQQPLAGREIVNVVLKVAAETVDPLTQHGDLDLCGTGIGAVGLVGVDQLLLLGGIKRHARRAALSVQTISLPGQGPAPVICWIQARSQASAPSWGVMILSASIRWSA